MLTFDPDSHTYKFDGRVVPSATQALGEWVPVPPFYMNTLTGARVTQEMFDLGADHGTAVHIACSILMGGSDLVWEDLALELINPIEQFQKWMDEWRPEPISMEESLYSKKYGYAGTPDLVANIPYRTTGLVAVVDYKTGAYSMAGPQVAAYEQLYRETSKYRKVIKRYVLQLPKTGPYQFKPLTDKRDWDFFRSRLFQYNYLNS